MTDFVGTLPPTLSDQTSDRAYDPAITSDAMTAPTVPVPTPSFADVDALDLPLTAGAFFSGFGSGPAIPADYPGVYQKEFNAAQEWFELIHVLPQSIALGNVLADTQVTIDIFNADRYLPHVFQNFINNAGAGISIIDLPTLPYQIPLLSGIQLTLEVTPDGPPTIDGTLDFDFDLYIVSIPITGTRIVLFPYPPEKELVEWLRFGTQVIEKKDGREQRIKMRKRPRQEFHLRVKSEGTDRQAMHSLLYDWQGRVFGLPVWTEPSYLTSAIAPGATSLPVDATAYGDFRTDGLLIIFTDRKVNEVLNISSIGPRTLGVSTSVSGTYPAGTRVMPVRTAVLGPQLQGSRKIVRLGDIVLRFMVLDNEVSIASAAAFASLSGKVLLSDYNITDGDFPEILARRLYVTDNDVGKPEQTSLWDRNRRGSQKGFLTRTRKQQWELKQLLYYLGGKLNSVYLPTFYDDLKPNANFSSGSPSMSIENIGYTTFVQNKKDRIRIHLNNGTIYDRTIVGSSVVDVNTETLTMNTTWPANIPYTDVRRIEYVETVRLDTDDVEIVHHDAQGQTKVTVPVVEVLFE